MGKKKRIAKRKTAGHSISRQIPAVPPPDDPLRRATESDPDGEYQSGEMAEKRLEAIRKTREMPTSDEESLPAGPE
jgi:hypothetical protein